EAGKSTSATPSATLRTAPGRERGAERLGRRKKNAAAVGTSQREVEGHASQGRERATRGPSPLDEGRSMKLVGWVLASVFLHGVLLAVVMTGVLPVDFTEVEPEPVEITIDTAAAIAPPIRDPEPTIEDPLPPDPVEPPPAPEQPAEQPEPRAVERTPPSLEPSYTEGDASEGGPPVSPT